MSARGFTPADRERMRAELLDAARHDPRLGGGAITGSGASGPEDEWSDIDLAFGVRDTSPLRAVLDDWSARMYRDHGALHHLDVQAGAWIYRVFLLASTLQVDLAFAPAAEFGARAPTFRLVFGEAAELPHAAPPQARVLVGYAWLYALHARSSLARGRLWQAEYMVSALRDQVLALACLRLGLPAREGRGLDRLPREVLRVHEASLIRSITIHELARAFHAATLALLDEVRFADGDLARRLEPALLALAPAPDSAGG